MWGGGGEGETTLWASARKHFKKYHLIKRQPHDSMRRRRYCLGKASAQEILNACRSVVGTGAKNSLWNGKLSEKHGNSKCP